MAQHERLFCVDCKYMMKGLSRCKRPRAGKVSLVTGQSEVTPRSCWLEREPLRLFGFFDDRCGPEGRHFSPIFTEMGDPAS